MLRRLTLATAVALALAAAACSGDPMDLSAAEAAMTETATNVLDDVNVTGSHDLGTDRATCQNDRLEDTNTSRATLDGISPMDTGLEPDTVHAAVADSLEQHGLSVDTLPTGAVRGRTDTYGLSFLYVSETGSLTVSGTTDCS